VLWRPSYFGVKPELVLKSGMAAWAPLGEGNASVERAEPTRYRRDWGGAPSAAATLSVTFVSSAVRSSRGGRGRIARAVGGRDLAVVHGTRGLGRSSLARNQAVVPIEVDPVDGFVTLEDRPLAAEALDEVALSRRYLLR
jgi:urease subunit alpha